MRGEGKSALCLLTYYFYKLANCKWNFFPSFLFLNSSSVISLGPTLLKPLGLVRRNLGRIQSFVLDPCSLISRGVLRNNDSIL
jgi:hypothetical protein